MSKLTLSFNLPEEHEEAEIAVKAQDYATALAEVRQRIFRPNRKHGYIDTELNNLVNMNPEYSTEIISALEEIFNEIIQEYDVEG
jgi:hypothetical protein